MKRWRIEETAVYEVTAKTEESALSLYLRAIEIRSAYRKRVRCVEIPEREISPGLRSRYWKTGGEP